MRVRIFVGVYLFARREKSLIALAIVLLYWRHGRA